ncbi:hypothetical protein MAR_023169, partial [Mya arenaria]
MSWPSQSANQGGQTSPLTSSWQPFLDQAQETQAASATAGSNGLIPPPPPLVRHNVPTPPAGIARSQSGGYTAPPAHSGVVVYHGAPARFPGQLGTVQGTAAPTQVTGFQPGQQYAQQVLQSTSTQVFVNQQPQFTKAGQSRQFRPQFPTQDQVHTQRMPSQPDRSARLYEQMSQAGTFVQLQPPGGQFAGPQSAAGQPRFPGMLYGTVDQSSSVPRQMGAQPVYTPQPRSQAPPPRAHQQMADSHVIRQPAPPQSNVSNNPISGNRRHEEKVARERLENQTVHGAVPVSTSESDRIRETFVIPEAVSDREMMGRWYSHPDNEQDTPTARNPSLSIIDILGTHSPTITTSPSTTASPTPSPPVYTTSLPVRTTGPETEDLQEMSVMQPSEETEAMYEYKVKDLLSFETMTRIKHHSGIDSDSSCGMSRHPSIASESGGKSRHPSIASESDGKSRHPSIASESGGKSRHPSIASASDGNPQPSSTPSESGGKSWHTSTASESGGKSRHTSTTSESGGKSRHNSTASENGGKSRHTSTASETGGKSRHTSTPSECGEQVGRDKETVCMSMATDVVLSEPSPVQVNTPMDSGANDSSVEIISGAVMLDEHKNRMMDELQLDPFFCTQDLFPDVDYSDYVPATPRMQECPTPLDLSSSGRNSGTNSPCTVSDQPVNPILPMSTSSSRVWAVNFSAPKRGRGKSGGSQPRGRGQSGRGQLRGRGRGRGRGANRNVTPQSDNLSPKLEPLATENQDLEPPTLNPENPIRSLIDDIHWKNHTPEELKTYIDNINEDVLRSSLTDCYTLKVILNKVLQGGSGATDKSNTTKGKLSDSVKETNSDQSVKETDLAHAANKEVYTKVKGRKLETRMKLKTAAIKRARIQHPYVRTPSPVKTYHIPSPLLSKYHKSSPLLSKDHKSSPLLSKDHKSSPLLSKDHKLSPLLSKDHKSSPLLSKYHKSSPLLSKDHNSSPLL